MDLSVRRGNDHDPSWFAGLNGLADEYDMIIVGAGISGCVFAERGSKELGLKSLIIDKRDHIGGNCYDFINKHGFRVSQYGVHLFHTKFDRVWEYVNRFSDWIPYEHRVKGKVKDIRDEYQIVPIPRPRRPSTSCSTRTCTPRRRWRRGSTRDAASTPTRRTARSPR